MKVLQLAASDLTLHKLLLPLIDRLAAEQFTVAAACAPGPYASAMASQGYTVHPVPMSRSFSPWRAARAVWALYRLMRRERFDVVHVHTPIAAVVGRVAARLAGVPFVIYTAHGFYFHERMTRPVRGMVVWMERLLGRLTDLLFTQSQEDAATAVQEGIQPADRVVWISNGVDIERFQPRESTAAVRRTFGIEEEERVVGFVGRLVREKGILELLEAMKLVGGQVPKLVLLIAGDNRTAGDRDRTTQAQVQRFLDLQDLPFRVVFTGFVEEIERVLQAIDVFALPSYREGMPRSIIEAMASGKPVVATSIRGCREEVVHGETGVLVPVGDAQALAAALIQLLSQQDRAMAMGARGQERARALFDERTVLDRQIVAYRRLLGAQLHDAPLPA